ncbi:3-methyl-2-oxobutanoate hydroxymethyltransferase [Ottowia thiooxydans]|uniref:3-methyl-2-oxobutanoate hydroxymethyltransferase n=1 Tax=Ottowia thiooxydans TaxID=219182 RepID=UPI00040AD931|nr:3-methyl-2-oxobutanoate hydroxymethyltransferase [Ottowia thiooxydans]
MSETVSTSGAAPAAPYGGTRPNAEQKRKKVTVTRLAQMRADGEKIAVLTAYDATFAAFADSAGVDCVLVGDSLGMVCQGRSSTVSVSLEEMRYHTQCVAQGLERHGSTALLIADLPYGTFHQSREQAFASAVVLMQAGAQMIKLEGGGWTVEIVAFLTERGIPVCAHLGLTPQTVAALGGYKVQGRQADEARQMKADALALEAAGASLLVLEMVPAELATSITSQMKSCATIGIGAGSGTAGQVLVMHDMLGMNLGRMAKFVRNFMQGSSSIEGAFAAYVAAVKDGSFPNNEQHAW